MGMESFGKEKVEKVATQGIEVESLEVEEIDIKGIEGEEEIKDNHKELVDDPSEFNLDEGPAVVESTVGTVPEISQGGLSKTKEEMEAHSDEYTAENGPTKFEV